jgi:hypothetical protein
MLTRVEVRTRRGTLLNLPLDDVENGLVINEIQGLDPVKATLVSSSFANQDGEQFHSSKREKRNIKLKMGLEPDYVLTTVKALRNRLYDFLMPQSEVTLRFYDDDGSYADIVGTVESNDAPVFTKDPGADISIVCFNPDFFDPNPVTESGMSTSDPRRYAEYQLCRYGGCGLRVHHSSQSSHHGVHALQHSSGRDCSDFGVCGRSDRG